MTAETPSGQRAGKEPGHAAAPPPAPRPGIAGAQRAKPAALTIRFDTGPPEVSDTGPDTTLERSLAEAAPDVVRPDPSIVAVPPPPAREAIPRQTHDATANAPAIGPTRPPLGPGESVITINRLDIHVIDNQKPAPAAQPARPTREPSRLLGGSEILDRAHLGRVLLS